MKPLKYKSSSYLTQNLHVVASGCKKPAIYNKINLILVKTLGCLNVGLNLIKHECIGLNRELLRAI